MHRQLETRKATNPDLDIRSVTGLEIRDARPGFIGSLVGYPAVWDTESRDMGGWVEVLKPGVFTRSLKEQPDVFAFYQHDDSRVLGRTSAGTLRLQEDQRGLRMELDLVDTQLNRDVLAEVRAGNVTSMSFGMLGKSVKAEWTKGAGKSVRSVREAQLIEVSIVSIPAYAATEVSARSFETFRKETSVLPLDLVQVCLDVEKLR